MAEELNYRRQSFDDRLKEEYDLWVALLGKEKARLKTGIYHSSWLRIYALKLSTGVYIVTGGAIKLTASMQEREHTLIELHKMEKVRRFILDQGIVDNDGFVEYLSEL